MFSWGQDLHCSFSQLFPLKFPSWHFPLSQLHGVCPVPRVTSWVTAPWTLPSHCSSPSQTWTPPTLSRWQSEPKLHLFSPLKEPSVPLRMTFIVLNFLPGFSTFLQRHLASSGVSTFSDPLPSLCAPHCLGHCSHLCTFITPSPGPDSGWAMPQVWTLRPRRSFLWHLNLVRGPSWISNLSFPALTSTRTSCFSCYFLNCVSYMLPIFFWDLPSFYMVLYKITFLFIQSINMPFMVFLLFYSHVFLPHNVCL